MKTGVWITIIVLLLAVIGVMAWFLFTTPAGAPAYQATSTPATTTTTTTTTTTQPMHTRVVVDSPKANGKVGKTFTVTGQAPGPWYFEAVFPIQVRDINDNVIAHAQGQAQGEWMTDAQVPFTASVTLDVNYSGPATLILLKDNPSGLPEKDDSLEVPIVIQ